MIYFDNAATTFTKPKIVREALFEAILKYGANPGRSGHLLSQKAAEAVYSVRQKVCSFFGAEDPAKVAFTLNCTLAANMVMKGVLCPGDHCIVSCLEHNAVMRPLHSLSQAGIEYDVAQVHSGSAEETAEEFERLMKPKTKLVFCMHASNVWGLRLPIEKIGEVCRRHGVLFAVDAAQSAGVLPIHMQAMNIDFLCVAPHKGLYAPAGTGILIYNTDRPLKTIIEGGTGTFSASFEQPEELPERLESGTINTPGICALSAGVDFVKKLSTQRIHSYEIGLVRRLYSGLSDIAGVKLYTDIPTEENNVAVLSFNITGMQSEEVAMHLSDDGFAVRAGLHCAPPAHSFMGTMEEGAVRVSPSVFNSAEEIDAFICCIRDYLRKKS